MLKEYTSLCSAKITSNRIFLFKVIFYNGCTRKHVESGSGLLADTRV